jgi:cytochrome oxidase Cu insertion factor (SCO1/SenC/PrrC family)
MAFRPFRVTNRLNGLGRIMRLTGILLLGAVLHVSATGLSQKVTLSLEKVPVQKVFAEVFRQTAPDIKVLVNEWQSAHGKNKMAYNFALPDTRGKIVHMSDFKGKVVLIDIWFSGCGGCMEVAQQLKNTIYKQFSNNPNIVFVSISGDRDKPVWLESIREGKYTRTENVNLYTGGLAFDHPFMKYYSFYGGPYLMIIGKNGRIYNSNPPIHTGLDALAECLREALVN